MAEVSGSDARSAAYVDWYGGERQGSEPSGCKASLEAGREPVRKAGSAFGSDSHQGGSADPIRRERHAPAPDAAFVQKVEPYGDGWIGTLHPSVECAWCGVGFVASTKESLDSLLANHRKVCREPKT